MAYDPNKTYIFTDSEGNTFTSKGDNGYVWQSMTEGVPISVDSNGEWYITPKLTTDGKTITAHIPNWFKNTDEYNQWKTYAPQFINKSMTQDTYDQLKDALTKLGNQGLLRTSLTKDISQYGVTDPELQKNYFENILQVGIEGSGGEAAKLNGIFGSDQNESAADFARSMKNVSKEKLSETMTWLYNIAEQGANGTYKGDQKQLADAVTVIKILNYIDDNYSQFGDGEEFKGLLEASFWQKLRTAGDSMLQTMAENFPLINLLARTTYGVGQAINGKPFSFKIEEGREQVLSSAATGGSLEGRDAAMAVGNVVGTVGNIAGTMTLSVTLGNVIGGTAAAATPGSFVAKMGMFAKTIPGAAVTDFFLNDIPIDLTFFATDWLRTGSFEKAVYNPEEEQPLFGIPVIGSFGPKVPGGIAMNALGDAIIDCALPILAIVGNTSFKKLDEWSNGGITRFREKVQMDNLKIQQKLTEIPVFGKGWKKFVNYMIGPEHAAFVGEARKAAIAEGSIAPYICAQNLLTLANHAGMTDIAPLYKLLDDELGISKSIKEFAKNADEFGGMGKTSVEWKELHGGVEKRFSKAIDDTLPVKVKQGLLDIERLSELKGQEAADGGLIVDAARAKEIAALEERVSKLPDSIKDFAERFSQLNKGVEMIAVKLGVSNEDWVAALMENPMWANYMTRQALFPGGESFTPTGGSVDPTQNKIWNESRKGYYADNYIDPVQALWLKTEALGRAYAWNERAKALVSFEIAQNNVVAGKGGVEAAKRLSEVKAKIKNSIEYRNKIGYDKTVSKVHADTAAVNKAYNKINNLMHLPESISLRSIYDSNQNPRIKGFVNDFESGKVKFADGVKEAAGLSDADASDIIHNTYAYKGNKITKDTNVPDNLERTVTQEKIPDYNAGVNSKGEPYKFTVENGKITSFEKITDSEGIADSINHLGGTYRITPDEVEKFGAPHSFALNRTILFYRDNMPGLPLTVNFQLRPGSSEGTIGFIKKPQYGIDEYKFSVQDGKIVAERFPVNLCPRFYAKGKEGYILDINAQQVATHAAPKNALPAEYTPIHEVGHATMARLALLEANRRIELGEIELPKDAYEAGYIVQKEFDRIHTECAERALERLGYKFSENTWQSQADTISTYASSDGIYHYETFSEAMADYAFNGDSAQKFSLAIVEEMKKLSERYTVAAAPGEVLKKNGLAVPKGLVNKDGGYNFPKSTAPKKTVVTEVVVNRPLLGQSDPTPFTGTMYHGSGKAKSEIYTFTQVPVLGEGKYWAFSKESASNFGNKIETKKLSLKNPLEIKTDDDWRRLTRMAGWEYPNTIGLDEATVKQYTSNLKQMVTDAGYDGIIVRVGGSKDGLLRDMFSVDQIVDYGVKPKTITTTKTDIASSDKAKAEWLDEWRQNNPYIKGDGIMSEEDYTKANRWDSYFQKEIRAYDPNSKSAMPELLAKRNGDFLEDLAKNSAKRLVAEIRAASVKGFSQELATMALSRNSKDIFDSLESFIVKRINQSAAEIAAKMPGGATESNLITARATLWSDDALLNDFTTMAATLVPDLSTKDVQNVIENIFTTQAKGFASVDQLPINMKELGAQQRALDMELGKSNAYAKKVGKEADQKIAGEYVGDATQIIHYKEGGEDVYVVVKDPVVASILKRPTDFKNTGVTVECLAQAANFFSRTYRIGTTGANPIAFVRNVLRDPLQATIQGGFNPLNMMISPDVFYHTLRGYGLDDATIDAVTQKLRNWAGESTLTAEMRERGMAKGISYRTRGERFAKRMNNRLSDNTKLFGKIIEKGEAPLEMWESMFRNQIAQQSFIKNYQRTGDVNKAMGAAMFDASNSTTNFSHSVGLFKRATSTVPYLSSAINGTRSFWVQFNADPVGMVARLSAGFMVPAMAITAWNLSSEERRKAYLNLPEWYRDSHIVLLDLENNVVAFPIPDELSQYYGTVRRLIEFTNDANQQGILSIMTQGAFGFLPVEVDGYFKQDGSIDFGRGSVQMLSGLMPQAVTAIYELIKKEDLFTGQDLSTYDGLNTTINTLANLFGTGMKNVANDIGMLCGASEKRLVGKSTADTLARDLFGMGFDDATNQFMNMVGSPTKFEDGKEIKATGLFAESERLKKEIEGLDRQIAVTKGEEKEKYEKEKEEKIQNFTKRVAGLVNNYMDLYTITGGLEEWMKSKIVSILTLGSAFSSSDSKSYQYQDMSDSYLNERGLAQQRYVNAGLPAGPSEQALLRGDNSIEIQAALNKLYGAPKQAAADFTNALKNTGLKDIRNEFYDAIEKIYDEADAKGIDPDYDLIEKIQARYLQSVDRILIPIVSQYGIDILNNNDFIDEVRRYVNGMVPSNDWKQSARNAKKYLSKKDFPLATVDVKKWLTQRYSSSMKDRGLASDAEVTRKLQEIKADIDAGKTGSAKSKIQELFNGVQRSNYYISSTDFNLLTQYNNMVK